MGSIAPLTLLLSIQMSICGTFAFDVLRSMDCWKSVRVFRGDDLFDCR